MCMPYPHVCEARVLHTYMSVHVGMKLAVKFLHIDVSIDRILTANSMPKLNIYNYMILLIIIAIQYVSY